MSIVYKLDSQGGFTCGDTETRITCYAYPTSTHAIMARKHAVHVAIEMLQNETAINGILHATSQLIRDYDTRNWMKLGM